MLAVGGESSMTPFICVVSLNAVFSTEIAHLPGSFMVCLLLASKQTPTLTNSGWWTN